MSQEWYEESPQEFADGFTESAGTHHADGPKPRFYVEQTGASWCVRDHEIVTPFGPARGKPMLVQGCSSQAKAEELAASLNETRGHAADEPKCVTCGPQPAGGGPPHCASCWSRYG
jgi:hypothetical protein